MRLFVLLYETATQERFLFGLQTQMIVIEMEGCVTGMVPPTLFSAFITCNITISLH